MAAQDSKLVSTPSSLLGHLLCADKLGSGGTQRDEAGHLISSLHCSGPCCKVLQAPVALNAKLNQVVQLAIVEPAKGQAVRALLQVRSQNKEAAVCLVGKVLQGGLAPSLKGLYIRILACVSHTILEQAVSSQVACCKLYTQPSTSVSASKGARYKQCADLSELVQIADDVL